MGPGERPIDELRERVRRYPAERYPVQHATAQFHLGLVLADSGELAGAEAALATAARLFDPQTLGAEHGKAMNALGSVLRLQRRWDDAARILVRAAAAFEAAGLPAERGAACYNLGLVRRESGDLVAALGALEQAQALFEDANATVHAAAAARELGTTRFTAGDLSGARRSLRLSTEIASTAGDEAGAGLAANVLGLVELADGRADAAAEALRAAVTAHPRAMRPAEYAVAKANLALAHEACGDVVRARVAARQALGVPVAPSPVREQAQAVLHRLGSRADDVMTLLEEEAAERRPAIVREELARWLDAGDDARRAAAASWVDGQLRRSASVHLAEAWLGGLLELPPRDLEVVMRSVVEALRQQPPQAQERFRAEVSMASARFHVPQLLRLRDGFNRVAVELGEEPRWR